jgi:hypothetical protein
MLASSTHSCLMFTPCATVLRKLHCKPRFPPDGLILKARWHVVQSLRCWIQKARASCHSVRQDVVMLVISRLSRRMFVYLSVGLHPSADVMRQRLQSEPFSLSAQEVLVHQLKSGRCLAAFELAADALRLDPIDFMASERRFTPHVRRWSGC